MQKVDGHNKAPGSGNHTVINQAFSKQAAHYDADDIENPVLQDWRKKVYKHIEKILKPGSRILEINAGTGIDALYLANQGHRVHATDISGGMIEQIQYKITNGVSDRFTKQQCGFHSLHEINFKEIDHIFSNFGGLNCANDLTLVLQQFPALLKPGGYATVVIMPKITPWEWLWIFKGKKTMAFRRFNQNGAMAHLEGNFFKTYYYSFRDIKKAFGAKFRLVKSEALGVFSPPPGSTKFFKKNRLIYSTLKGIDTIIRKIWPFNRWGDHIIVTFQYIG